MQVLHDEIKLSISGLIKKALDEIYFEKSRDIKIDNIYNNWGEPPKANMGHLALPCFPFAKILKESPAEISKKILEQLDGHKNKLIKEIKCFGPYINFFLTINELGSTVVEKILNNEFFQKNLTKNSPKTMIEYSQPNTHKELHIGHMRNLALGHSLILLHRYCDYEVISTTFPGDVGTHVAKCLWYLKYHNKEKIPNERKGAFLGKIYSKAHIKLEDEIGTDKEEGNRQILGEILSQLQKEEGEFYTLWKETREWSIELMQDVYKWADVEFDQWYWESDVDATSVDFAKELHKKGYLVESDGAIGADLSDDNLGFCLMIKSDGNGLYATKDVELAHRKFDNYSIEKSIYVVDNRQSRHFAQVFKVLEKIGYKYANQCYHLAYESVELPDGAMSSRKGNVVPIQELIDQMEDHIKKNYLDQYRGKWTPDEIEKTAGQVALGAIMYGMLKVDPQRKIVFDMNEWLKLDGESGPYLQYCRARINSLYLKLKDKFEGTADWSLLKHPVEEALALKLSHFNSIVLQSAENFKPSQLCSYLFDLAKLYNNFYSECSVALAATPELGLTRLLLSKATGDTLEKGLELLGMPSPEKM